MKKQNKIAYKSIAVIAIHMQDAEALPYEVNSEYIMEQYQKFLNDCINILEGSICLDIIAYNNHIYGIYDGCYNTTDKMLEVIGIRISRLANEFNCRKEDLYAGKLLCGIGIAVGTAVNVSVENFFRQKGMWMGSVFNKAYSMAQMSVCDGRKRVFIDSEN